MQFSKFIVAAAAFALAQAGVEFTNPSFNSVTAGKPFNITWSGASGPVSITLKDGPATALVTVSTVASGLTGTSYVWNVPSTLEANTYALQIDDSTGVPNYSEQFQLIGGASSSSAAASSTSSGSSSTGSSTSASTTTSTGSSTTSTGSSTGSSTSSKTSSASKTTSSGSSTTGSSTTSATGSTSSTSAPSSASGLSSPIAFVFLALAAILTLN